MTPFFFRVNKIDNSMDYTVVFDVVQSGYRQWWFAATGLFVTALILRDLFVRRKILTKIQLNAFRIGLGNR